MVTYKTMYIYHGNVTVYVICHINSFSSIFSILELHHRVDTKPIC